MPRAQRPSPAELATGWPDLASSDPSAEVARRFARRLRAAIGERSIRSVAVLSDVNHATVLAILAGRAWPDLYTISKLERGLQADLWPGRLDPGTPSGTVT
ncbi:hypothetical protein WDJ51_07605 [Rathayibacter sp. YIM 133350]|uniref:hypothetical protein n=1 Tax=Rathayibacter sp. YIM 133350 TaxID=3131992 RepID=UPI00307DAA81